MLLWKNPNTARGNRGVGKRPLLVGAPSKQGEQEPPAGQRDGMLLATGWTNPNSTRGARMGVGRRPLLISVAQKVGTEDRGQNSAREEKRESKNEGAENKDRPGRAGRVLLRADTAAEIKDSINGPTGQVEFDVRSLLKNKVDRPSARRLRGRESRREGGTSVRATGDASPHEDVAVVRATSPRYKSKPIDHRHLLKAPDPDWRNSRASRSSDPASPPKSASPQKALSTPLKASAATAPAPVETIDLGRIPAPHAASGAGVAATPAPVAVTSAVAANLRQPASAAGPGQPGLPDRLLACFGVEMVLAGASGHASGQARAMLLAGAATSSATAARREVGRAEEAAIKGNAQRKQAIAGVAQGGGSVPLAPQPSVRWMRATVRFEPQVIVKGGKVQVVAQPHVVETALSIQTKAPLERVTATIDSWSGGFAQMWTRRFAARSEFFVDGVVFHLLQEQKRAAKARPKAFEAYSLTVEHPGEAMKAPAWMQLGRAPSSVQSAPQASASRPASRSVGKQLGGSIAAGAYPMIEVDREEDPTTDRAAADRAAAKLQAANRGKLARDERQRRAAAKRLADDAVAKARPQPALGTSSSGTSTTAVEGSGLTAAKESPAKTAAAAAAAAADATAERGFNVVFELPFRRQDVWNEIAKFGEPLGIDLTAADGSIVVSYASPDMPIGAKDPVVLGIQRVTTYHLPADKGFTTSEVTEFQNGRRLVWTQIKSNKVGMQILGTPDAPPTFTFEVEDGSAIGSSHGTRVTLGYSFDSLDLGDGAGGSTLGGEVMRKHLEQFSPAAFTRSMEQRGYLLLQDR